MGKVQVGNEGIFCLGIGESLVCGEGKIYFDFIEIIIEIIIENKNIFCLDVLLLDE